MIDMDQSVSTLNSAVEKEVTNLNGISTHVDILQQNMKALSNSLDISSLFATQLSDIEIILKTISDIFDFLDQLKILDDVFESSSKSMQDRITQCENINEDIKELQSIVSKIASLTQGVVFDLPSSTTIANAQRQINGWSHGANSLSILVDSTQKLVTSDQQNQIDTMKQKISSSCSDLVETLSGVNTIITQIEKNIVDINSSLCDYASALTPISKHCMMIEADSMPKLNKAAKIMNLIDSIINPISCVLVVEGCTDANSMQKQAANGVLNGIKQGAKSEASSLMNTISTSIDGIVENTTNSYLPLNQLSTDVSNAIKILNEKVLKNLTTLFVTLKTNMDDLDTKLKQRYKYTYTAKNGKTLTAENQFLDQDTISSMSDFLNNIKQN